MIDNLLGQIFSSGFSLGWYITVIAYFFIIVCVLSLLIRVFRYFQNASKEQKLIRFELGKLAEEVHKLRLARQDRK